MREFLSTKKTETKFDTDKDSHGWIQFKGSNICLDVYCLECGTHSHIDGDFIYFLECPECKTVFELNGHIELIKRDRKEIEKDGGIYTPEIY